MKNYQLKRNGGFTLVEIAIVLVIIGLLLGGILKGQELMTNAKIKRTVNDFNGITAAIYSYMDRYAKLPGDDDNALARWAGVCGGRGSGNGYIEGSWASTRDTDESRKLWSHLRAAGLINGSLDNCTQPTHAFGGRIGVQRNAYGMTGTVICLEGIEGKIGEILDRQLDDGQQDSGNLRGGNAGSGGAWVQANSYNICKKL